MKKKLLLFLLVLVLTALLLGTVPSGATSLDDLDEIAGSSDDPLAAYREYLEMIREQAAELESQIKQQENLLSGLKNDIAALDRELTVVNQQMIVAQNAIDELEASIIVCEEELVLAEERRDERQAFLESRLVNYYTKGDIDLLDVIFDTSTFQDFVTVVDMVDLIMAQDQRLVEELAEEIATIAALKETLELEREGLIVVRDEYEDMRNNLNVLEQQKIAAIDEANWTLAEYTAYEDSLSQTAEAVTATIRELMKTSDDTLSFGGSMIWPLPSPWNKDWITSPYGWRQHPIYGDNRFHSGIDIAADGGTKIYAAADGKIILREYYGGYGNCIMIDHGNGVISLYAHMSAYGSFVVGDYVFTGDIVGYVGTTGTSSGNHLHFETRLNGEYADPWTYLN